MKIKKTLKELSSIKGRHTELVSFYIPSGHNLVEAVNQLSSEKSTAVNIKSKATRKNVVDALEKIMQHLKLFRKTPENGLIVFAGNVSPAEGKTDLRMWSFQPPEKMNVKLYWCDQVFVLDPLKELVREKEIYGLLVLDASEASIGLLKGKQIVRLKHIDSTVPGKSIKGGMCVHKNTLVNNGKIREIHKLKVGDKVLSFNFKKNKPTFSKVEAIKKRKSKEAYRLLTDIGAELLATKEHVVLVKTLLGIKEKNVDELKAGDTLLSIDYKNNLKPVKIIAKSKVSKNDYFYDIHVPGNNNFVANSLIIHNSQMRYDRVRDDALNEFFRKVAELASNIFLDQPDLKGVLIGGPGPNKDTFNRKEYLNYQIQKKVLGVKDIGYTDEYGLKELATRSQDLIKESKYVKERELLKKFFTEIQKNGNVVYGYEKVKKALDMGAVDIMLISENFSMYRVKFKCHCGFSTEKDVAEDDKKHLCDNCNSLLKVEEENDLSEILIKDAEKYGTKIEWISVDTEEGRQFSKIGGLGGLLRYKIS